MLLKPLRNPFPQARLRVFQVTTTGTPTISVDVGDDDLSASSRSAAGKVLLTVNEKHARGPVVIGQVGASIADGGYVNFDTAPASGNAITLEALGAAGSGDDGTFYGLELGWDFDSGSDAVSPQLVTQTGNADILVGGIVAADGSGFENNLGEHLFTVSKSSTGVYVLTLRHFAGARDLLPFVCPIGSAQKSARITAVSDSSFTVSTFSSAEAAEDNKFCFLVAVPRNPDLFGGRFIEAMSTGLEPYIMGFKITNTAGTPSISLNVDDAAITDNGTGDYSITLPASLEYEGRCIAIAIAKDNRAQLIASPTSTVIRVGVFNATGSAADDDVFVIVLGDRNAESTGM